jgi:hypothetical protein
MFRHCLGSIVLIGCTSSDVGQARPDGGSNPGPHDASVLPRPIPRATGATDLLVGHTVGGEFSGYGMNWTGLPVVALLGDGRAVFATVVGNPTSRQMKEVRLSPAEVDRILEAADEHGLFAGSTKGSGPADANYSILTLRAADRCVTHQETPPPVEGEHAAFLAQLRQSLSKPSATAWAYERVAIEYWHITPAIGCADARAWPLEAPPDAITQRTCRVLDRQAAAPLAPQNDNEFDQLEARMDQAGSACVFYVYRPLLPNEAGCPLPDPFESCR